MSSKRTLCIIPARGGSKRIPHKNLINFKGKPIIAYSIEAAKAAGIADIIMVSTDNEEISRAAVQYGAEVPFYRSRDTSSDHAGIADVLIEVIHNYEKIGESFDYIICILATAPLINPDYMIKAYEQLIETPSADSICSVEAFSYPPQRGLIIEHSELKMVNPDNYLARSQELETIYHDCGQFFIFKRDALLRDKMLYTKHTIPFILNEMESQDIDNLTDLKIAELKYDLLFKENRK